MDEDQLKPIASFSGEPAFKNEMQAPLYRELRRLAASQMSRESAGQTIQATELVHEAWIRLYGNDAFESPQHLLATAARTMRRILIDRARRKARSKRGGDFIRVGMAHVDEVPADPEDQVLLIDEAIARLEQIDPICARVVILKFFGDLSNKEVAAELGVSERSVERYWAFAKAWLFREVSKQI